MSTSTTKTSKKNFAAQLIEEMDAQREEAAAIVEAPETAGEPEENQAAVPATSAPETTAAEQGSQEKVIARPESSTDDMDLILKAKSKAKRGHQKSVYLDEDNFRYIQDKCELTGAGFSDVLNLIIKNFIESRKK